MNIIKTRNGGYLFTLKGKIPKDIYKEYKEKEGNADLKGVAYIFGFIMLVCAPFIDTYPYEFYLMPLPFFSFFLGKDLYLKKKKSLIKILISPSGLVLKIDFHNFKFSKYFKREHIEQLYIQNVKDKKYILNLISIKGERRQFPLIVGKDQKIPELIDLKHQIHEFFEIEEDLLEGELEYQQKVLPKRKRQFFNIFYQTINDIRKNGIVHLKGDAYEIKDIEQIDWNNGMTSYRFLLEEDIALYYHPSPTERLIIKENEITYNNVLGLHHFSYDLSDIDTTIIFNGVFYFQAEQNKGQLFHDKELVNESIFHFLYEDEEKKNFIRIYTSNGTIRTMLGEIVEDHQLQEILPEIEDK